MDNQPVIKNTKKQDNQNKYLMIILGIITVVIIVLITCILLVPHFKKSQNANLLQQAERLDTEEDKCQEIVETLSDIDESVLEDEESIKYYRYLFVCYDALGDEQKSDLYYSRLLDVMNKQGLTNGG